jgi:ribosomal protein S25
MADADKAKAAAAASDTKKADDIWGADEAAEIDRNIAELDTSQLNTRTRMMENNIR